MPQITSLIIYTVGSIAYLAYSIIRNLIDSTIKKSLPSSMKRVGPKIESWGTAAFIGHHQCYFSHLLHAVTSHSAHFEKYLILSGKLQNHIPFRGLQHSKFPRYGKSWGKIIIVPFYWTFSVFFCYTAHMPLFSEVSPDYYHQEPISFCSMWHEEIRQKILTWNSMRCVKARLPVLQNQQSELPMHYKTTFCHIIALDIKRMTFFSWRKNVSYSKYLYFCLFKKSTNFKVYDIIVNITAHLKPH